MSRLRFLLLVLLCLGLTWQAALCESIGEAKARPTGSFVSTSGSVTYVEPQAFYIQSSDRSSGILVIANTPYAQVGKTVSVAGALATVGGERAIVNAQVVPMIDGQPVRPLAMQNRWIGGKNQSSQSSIQDFLPFHIPGDGTELRWEPAHGLSNTGLLVTTWGIINAVYYSPTTSARWFYVDDGFGAVSDYGDQGVLVYSDVDVKEHSFVRVTGISSLEPSFDHSTRLIRVLRPRGAQDVSVLVEDARPVLYPFSDEFDTTTLNKLWDGFGVSLTTNPGWLTIKTREGWGDSLGAIAQSVPGDWDLEIRVRMQVAADLAYGYLHLDLGNSRINVRYATGSTLPADARRVTLGNATSYDPGATTVSTYSGDTCYVRIRHRQGTLFCSASGDGANYSGEVSRAASFYMLYLAAESSDMSRPVVTALVDYVRFTNVSR